MSEADFDPYHRWLGIRDPSRPPNFYRLLGLELFEDDRETIEAAADRQMAHVRTYQTGPHSAISQKILNELATAKLCLLNPVKKNNYDGELRQKLAAPPSVASVPPSVNPYSGIPFEGGGSQPYSDGAIATSTPDPAVGNSSWDILPAPLPPSPPLLMSGNEKSGSLTPRAKSSFGMGDDGTSRWRKLLKAVAITWCGLVLIAILIALYFANFGDGKRKTPKPRRRVMRMEDKLNTRTVPRKTDPLADIPVADLKIDRRVKTEEPRLCLAMLADGRTVLTGGYGKSLEMWDVFANVRVRSLPGHDAPVHSLALSPTGKWAASLGDDNALVVWNVEARADVYRREDAGIRHVAFSPDGAQMALAMKGEKILFLEVPTGKDLREKRLSGEGAVNSVAYSPDGKFVIAAGESRHVVVYSMENLQQEYRFKGHLNSVTSLAVSSDSSRIVSGSKDNTVRVWDLTRQVGLDIFRGHESEVEHVAISNDGRLAVSGSRDGAVRVWDLAVGRAIAKSKGSPGPVSGVAITSNGKQAITTSSADIYLRIWNLEVPSAIKKRP